MEVLVTGGCGYIGSHVVSALFEKGFTPITVDDLSTGFKAALIHDTPLYVGNVGDQSFLHSVFSRHDIKAVLHFAASIVVPDSMVQPLEYYTNNTAHLLNLLQVVDRHQVDKLVFSSSAAVYGDHYTDGPIGEDELPQPINPYGHSKLFSEQMIRDLAKASSLRYSILRYFNVAGARPDGLMGQRSARATHLIKIASEVAVGKRDSMAIYGADYPTPDGTCVRDYVHVCDLADAHVLALENLINGGASQTLNCGYGHGYSVCEVLDAMESVVGRSLDHSVGPRRVGDAACLIAACERMRTVYGWQPRYDNLETIVSHSYQFEQNLRQWVQ